MGTTSDIIIKRPGYNEYASIQCNWDGYLSGVGKILLEHYKTHDQVVALVQLGELSELGETLEDCVPYSLIEDVEPEICLEPHLDEHITGDYSYMFDNGEWVYRTIDNRIWKKLTAKEIKKDEESY